MSDKSESSKSFVIVLLLVIVSVFSAKSGPSAADSATALALLGDSHTRVDEFVGALRILSVSGLTNEPPEFWSKIANNPDYPVLSRRRAVLQLFARHFKPGMTFWDVGRLLNHPTWLGVDDACFWSRFGPPIPGVLDGENAAIMAVLHQKGNGEYPVIWFRFKGESVPVHDLYDCLKGTPSTPASLDIGRIKIIGVVCQDLMPNWHAVHDEVGNPSLVHTN